MVIMMRKTRIPLLLVLFLVSGSFLLFAENKSAEKTQSKYTKLIEQANEHIEKEAYNKAFEPLTEASKLKPRRALAWYHMAEIHSLQQGKEKALSLLSKAARLGYGDVVRIQNNPRFEAIKDEKKFIALIKKYTSKDKYAGKKIKNSSEGMDVIRLRSNNHPKLGELAPDFKLEYYDSDKTLRLTQFQGHSPVVLVFGSCT